MARNAASVMLLRMAPLQDRGQHHVKGAEAVARDHHDLIVTDEHVADLAFVVAAKASQAVNIHCGKLIGQTFFKRLSKHETPGEPRELNACDTVSKGVP